MTKNAFVWFGRDSDPPPPRHSKVPAPDAARIRAELATHLGTAHIAGPEIARDMLARSESVGTISETEPLDFEAMLGSCALATPEYVLLAWDPLETLFKVSFREFVSALPLLFDLGVFDLLVMDEQLRWAVYLMHYGEVRVVRP